MYTHLAPTLVSALLGLTAGAGAASVKLEYQYNLATVAGDIRTSSVGLNYDPAHGELYVVGYGQVRVFNAAGMEIYRFGDDLALGTVYAVAALEGGDLLVSSIRDGKAALLRCNYRGELIEEIQLTGVPGALRGMGANAMAYAQGRVYLVDLAGMRALLVDTQGHYLASYDFAELLEAADKRQDQGMNGFGVTPDGSMVFTVAPEFKAHVVSLTGQVRSFGKPGSAPGSFGIVAGIGADARGRLYVVDSLKCAVLVFDRDFNFLGEFGSRGVRPGSLLQPTSLVVADGRVFVSQNGGRGVTAFRVREE
jgi:hypothetical protein